MTGTDIKVKSSEGSEFDCYLATPDGGRGPGVIVVAAVDGVSPDIRALTDDLAAHGFVAAAPDMFWRTDPGHIVRTEEGQKRIKARSQPRAEIIETGVRDVGDVAEFLSGRNECNGKIGAIGFCYGGPYAILGQTRFGLDAGCSYHGTNLGNYTGDLKKASNPLLIHWGDEDHAAPPELVEEYRGYDAEMDNMALHIFPGVKHGYMMAAAAAYDADAFKYSWDQTLKIFDGLKGSA